MSTTPHGTRGPAEARLRWPARFPFVRMLPGILLSSCVAAAESGQQRVAAGAPAPTPGTAAEIACSLPVPEGVPATALRCFTVAVPQDRALPGATTLSLHVVVIRSQAPSPDPDPVFYFTGGPGQAASDGLAGTLDELGQAGTTRDLVLIDQRGTGRSHPLRCELNRTEEALRGWLTGDFPRAALRACREGLLARGIDPARYATADAVMDAEAVRRALAYDRLNLFGVSYGTRVALEYARRYPERVRTATLWGLHTPDSRFPLHVAADAQRALDLTLRACDEDAFCIAAYPALRDDLSAAFDRARSRPVRLPLGGARDGDSITVTPGILAGALLFSLYSAEGAAALPMAVHSAAGGDVVPWVAPGLLTAYGASQSLALGMYLSVVCTEDVPRIAAGTGNAGGGFLGDTLVRNLSAACSEWLPGAVAPPAPLLQTSAPMLILTGEIDPVTPPHWGETLLDHVPNGRQVVFAAVGHVPSMPECARHVAAAFIDAADARAIDVSCAAGGRRPRFALPSVPAAAVRDTTPENVQGTWDLYWQTARGPSRNGYLVITQHGRELAAEVHGRGELRASGRIVGRQVLLSGRRIVPFEIQAQAAGDTLRGTLKVLTTERHFTGVRRR